MTLRTLIESLHRLYTDPRVSPNTIVEVELEYHVANTYLDDDGITRDERETIKSSEPILALALAGTHGGRSIILSACPRHDAIAR